MKLLLAQLILVLICQAVGAQTPVIDGVFPTQSLDDDPNLIIVRELYNPEKRIQSIYLRLYDGSPDYEVTSGEIFVNGAEIIRLITSRIGLKNSDQEWAIPGVNYGRERGMDGPDPLLQEPVEDSEFDYAEVRENSLRFWFGTGSDIDDLRMLIRYPNENGTASISPLLYYRRGPDPHPISGQYPVSNEGGIQVGGDNDFAPDDGLYDNAVTSIENLKLRLEDLDIVEPEIDLGTLNFMGGAAGPGTLTLENGFHGNDPDGDNGFDQNGDFAPIESTGPLNHLRYEVRPLNGPNNQQIPTSGIQVLGLPRVLENGMRTQGRVSVDAPADLPEGRYSGFLTVWEDNNENGINDDSEPSDSVSLIVHIQDRVDAAPDLGSQDATVEDASVDVKLLAPDRNIDDARPLELGVQDAETDARQATDAAADVPRMDNGQRADEGAVMGDQEITTPTGDIQLVQEDASDTDTTGTASDATTGLDGATPFKRWPSLPQGGTISCQTTPWTSPLVLLCILLLPLVRRRQ